MLPVANAAVLVVVATLGVMLARGSQTPSAENAVGASNANAALSPDSPPSVDLLAFFADNVDIRDLILERMGGRATVHLLLTCKGLHQMLQAGMDQYVLLDCDIADGELDRRARLITSQALAEFTTAKSMVLYDRIVQSGLRNDAKLDLIELLCGMSATFTNWIWSLPIPTHVRALTASIDRHGLSPVRTLAALAIRLLKIPAPAVTECFPIPPAVVLAVERAIARYRRMPDWPSGPLSEHFAQRYPAPFNQIWDYQAEIAADILLAGAEVQHDLARLDVVAALARCGVRFDLVEFLRHVPIPPASVAIFFPFLRWFSPTMGTQWVQGFATIPAHYQMPLLTIPYVASWMMKHPAELGLYLHAIRNDLHRHELHGLCDHLQVDNRVLNALIPSPHGTEQRITDLLTLPMFDLFTRVPHHDITKRHALRQIRTTSGQMRSPLDLLLYWKTSFVMEHFNSLVVDIQQFVDYVCGRLQEGQFDVYVWLMNFPDEVKVQYSFVRSGGGHTLRECYKTALKRSSRTC